MVRMFSLLCRRMQVTEEVARAQVLAFAMKGDLCLIEGQDARHADIGGSHLQARHVVRPLFDVHDDRVVLRHIDLADAADTALPWSLRRGI